jgi:hypothetical protein
LKGENKDRYHQIGKLKKETAVESLCNGISESFAKYVSAIGENFKSMFSQPSQIKNV